jgi:hypothetical protein
MALLRALNRAHAALDAEHGHTELDALLARYEGSGR